MKLSQIMLVLAPIVQTVLSISMFEDITFPTKTTTTTTTPDPSFLTWLEIVTLVTKSGTVSTSTISTDCGGPTNCIWAGIGVTTINIGSAGAAGPTTKSPSTNPLPTMKTSTASPSGPTTASDPLDGINSGTSKTATIIVIGVLVPLVVVTIGLMIYFIRKSRNRRGGVRPPKQARLVSWHPRTSVRDSSSPPSPAAISLDNFGRTPGQSPFHQYESYHNPPPVPPKSPDRYLSRSAPPPRPPRPDSLPKSLFETTPSSPPPGSYLHDDAISDRAIAPNDSSSQRGYGYRYSSNPAGKSPKIQQLPGGASSSSFSASAHARPPPTRDNSRNLFARTARERGLDHTQLARESLQLSGDELARHITPPPLVIRKRGERRSRAPYEAPAEGDPLPQAGPHRGVGVAVPADCGIEKLCRDERSAYVGTGTGEEKQKYLQYAARLSQYHQDLPQHPQMRSEDEDEAEREVEVEEEGGASLMNDGSDSEIDEAELRRNREEALATLIGERGAARAASSVYSDDEMGEQPVTLESLRDMERAMKRLEGGSDGRQDGDGHDDYDNDEAAKGINWSKMKIKGNFF